jgi:two-component system chemotaxis response regulator CheB
MPVGVNVRVLVVDDSPIARALFCSLLKTEPGISVIGTAENGKDAVEKTVSLKPDVVLMDIQMPVMDGLEATKAIMAAAPCPIIIVSSIADRKNAHSVFSAMSAGALDMLEKPKSDSDWSDLTGILIRKVRLFSGVRPPDRNTIRIEKPLPRIQPEQELGYQLVAMGASTGGPSVIRDILASLPGSFPVGIVIVQHLPKGFVSVEAEWLQGETELNVRQAVDGELIKPSTAYLAPEGRHLQVRAGGILELADSRRETGRHCPSIDHFFHSVARTYGSGAIGVLLTGMGNDGAEGLKALREAGGYAIVQEKGSCAVFGMPKAALEMGVDAMVMSPYLIGQTLINLTGSEHEKWRSAARRRQPSCIKNARGLS